MLNTFNRISVYYCAYCIVYNYVQFIYSPQYTRRVVIKLVRNVNNHL